MILLFIVLVLIVLAIFTKMKRIRKKILLIIGIIFSIGFIIYIGYYFKNIYINPNWIMQIERSDIDGFSNKIYIYSNYDIIIEYYPAEEYQKTKVKLDRDVDLEKVYNYINNCAGNLDKNYKVVLKNGLNKEDKVVFISSKDEEIKDFIEKLDVYMIQQK